MYHLGVSGSFCFVDIVRSGNRFPRNASRPCSFAFVLIITPPCSAYEEQQQKIKEQAVEALREDVIWFKQTINNARVAPLCHINMLFATILESSVR